MEIRAREDTPMSNDLTPAIPPIAASLHHKFLPSHCSACFGRLPSSSSSTSLQSTSNNPLSCSRCSATVQYCSRECAAADSDSHLSSGECSLFALCAPSPPKDTTDVRAALRLIHLFERLGLLSSPVPCSDSPRRIGGLLASGLVEVMDEGGELAERIREGATLMARARNCRLVEGCRLQKVSIEEEVLWAVMTNAVEVEIGDLGGLGVAVYGPWFSWFNHSCVPNACYRFELSSGFKAIRPCDLGSFKVLPAGGVGEALDVWKTWTNVESSLARGLCWFGPRIIIRNIKPLKKDAEVCIAYTDLLQPKAPRHFDLWSRYRFICHCKRCCVSPQMYMDYILSCDARSLNLENKFCSDSEWMDVSDYLEETIAEYMFDGTPEICCRKLEDMLCHSFHCMPSDALESRFRLHPLHFLSLKTCIVLSSAYRIQASNVDDVSKKFKMARAAAACSLLIACATHHLFMSDTSIIQNTALFWITAGESILYLIRIAKSSGQFVVSDINLTFVGSHFAIEGQSKSQEGLLVSSARFIDSVSLIMINLWPFLANGHSYMECIENPANFRSLQITNSNKCRNDGRNAGYVGKYGGRECIVEWNGLHQLAVCCLVYARYLANICHGPESYLSGKVGYLERVLKETVL
ncbi:protein SET DOMAIN GROUP 41 [Dendrobium catenatum]|nr:protein SET DOMAIN GROUP 41 [Dendrobium catenatum]